jgi:hypothetical protein
MVDDGPMPAALTQISAIVIGYGVLVTVVALVVTIRRVERPGWLGQLVWMLELLLVIRAVAGLGAIAGGTKPDEYSAHVGYLIASVCILPIAMQSVSEDRATWSAGVIAVAALAVTVVAVRLQMTWT